MKNNKCLSETRRKEPFYIWGRVQFIKSLYLKPQNFIMLNIWNQHWRLYLHIYSHIYNVYVFKFVILSEIQICDIWFLFQLGNWSVKK